MGEKDITEVPGIGKPKNKPGSLAGDRTGKAATALRNAGYKKVRECVFQIQTNLHEILAHLMTKHLLYAASVTFI